MRSVLIKVGGSLLTVPDLSERLLKLFDAVAADQIMLLAGGGQTADLVRDWDRIYKLDDEAAHWLAIDAMCLTARLLAKLLPESNLLAGRDSAENAKQSAKLLILDPRPIIEEALADGAAMLPLGWNCTSDSIAAWIATHWKVDSLVLAKSVDAPTDHRSVDSLQAAPVDACFHSVVDSNLPVYWCNVRARPESVGLWKPASSP